MIAGVYPERGTRIAVSIEGRVEFGEFLRPCPSLPGLSWVWLRDAGDATGVFLWDNDQIEVAE